VAQEHSGACQRGEGLVSQFSPIFSEKFCVFLLNPLFTDNFFCRSGCNLRGKYSVFSAKLFPKIITLVLVFKLHSPETESRSQDLPILAQSCHIFV
jgi:hypothetical protein